MQGLGPRVIDDQHFIRFVLGDAGQHFDLFQQAGGFQRAGEEFLAPGANGGQACGGVGFVQAEKQQRQFLLQAFLGFGSELEAQPGAAEIHVHHDGGWQALGHGRAKRRYAVQGLCTHTKEFQLLGQALGTVVIGQHHVDRLAHRRQKGLFQLVALAQAGAGQALHQTVEFSDQLAAQAAAVFVHRFKGFADMVSQLTVLGLFEALGKAQQA